MATSVVYPTSMGNLTDGSTLSGVAASRACAFNVATQATVAQQVNATGTGTSMASGTFTNTPTSGNVLLAVIQRTDNNAISTSPSGWTLLTANGGTGRRLEVWWYRSTGVVADKGSFTFSTSAGSVRWGIQLFEFGGNAAFRDPVVKTAGTNGAANTTFTATTTPTNSDDTVGFTLTAIAAAGASLGAGGITTAFSGTGTAEATTAYYDSTFGNGATGVVDLYTNATYGTDTYGTQWTLSASRASTYAVIQLAGGGITHSAANQIIAGVGYSLYGNAVSQGFCVYDTSSIPSANTITSASLGVYGYSGTNDPTSGDLQARYYGTSISNTRGYNNNLWFPSPSSANGMTLLASYPASSAFTQNTSYTLTNNGTNLVSNINRSGNTVILFTTSDYVAASTTPGLGYSLDTSSTRAPLTIVHNFQGTATATASATASPSIAKSAGIRRTLTNVTTTLTPTISRTIGYARTIASSLDLTPTVTAVRAYLRTLAVTMTATPVISRTISVSKTIAALTTGTAAISRQAAIQRAIDVQTTVTSSVNRTIAYARTITSTITASPLVATARALSVTIASTINAISQTAGGKFIAQVPRILRLAGTSTIRLGQTVTARLTGRSTIRLPKENP
jgi:hypothetical protein